MHAKQSFSGPMVATIGILLCLSAAARRGDDGTQDKVAELSRRVQRLEDALGATGRDLSNEPLARRLERVEETLITIRATARPSTAERSARDANRELEAVRRAQQDMQRALDRVQRLVQASRDGGDDTRRLESQLSGIQRSLNSLESRVSRLERG